ncbi:MAG: NAD-dependent epimerase/dehydratase family protein [Bacteroidales bacterium]
MADDKKIAIIGANGFIGKHIAHYLSNGFTNIEFYDMVEETDLLNYHRVDLTDKESVALVNLNVDYIFMFAGLTGTYAGFDAYNKYVTVNEIGLLNLLDTIKNSQFRPKVVFPSTRLVYKGVDSPLKEEDEKDSKTIYAANKIACEGYLKAYHDSFEIPYTVFRICIPYGNLLSNDYSFGTVGFFIKQAKAGIDIMLYGGGTIKRTFTHMEDLCYQITEGAFHPQSNGEIYNVEGETLSLREAAEIIAKKYGVSVKAVPWPERDLRIESDHTYFDGSKIQALLQLKPYKRLIDFTNDL